MTTTKEQAMTAQTYRVEVRFDVTGTAAETNATIDKAFTALSAVEGVNEVDVTEVWDENWNEVDLDKAKLAEAGNA